MKPWLQLHCRNASSWQPKCPCGWQGRRVADRARAEREGAKHDCDYGEDEW